MNTTNFKVETDSDGIALVTWDIPGRSMNVLDTKTIEELGAIVEATSADAAIKGVVITSGKDAFCAGADLSMLDGMNKTFLETKKAKGDEAAQQMLFDESRKLSLTLRKIETSGKPWVAAINGLALGGAFEVTLACHYRIASDNPKTRLGLPEIKVGLFPGGGGTQRLPRLLQPQSAMQMLLKGDPINLRKRQGDGSGRRGGARGGPHHLRERVDQSRWQGGRTVGREGLQAARRRRLFQEGMQIFPAGNGLYRRQTYDNYPAARAIMQCAYEGLQLPMDAALRVESRYFANVLQTKEAAAMIRSLFLSMQELNKGARRPQDVPPTKVKKLAVIGAGFMGASVGFVSARAGIDVVLIDRDQASADKGRGHAQAAIDALVAKGRAKPDDAEKLMAKITATSDFNVLKDCDLVIEAVFEDRAVKAEHLQEGAAAV